MDDERIERLYAKLRRSLGNAICAALDDPTVVEIQINEDEKVWLDHLTSGKELLPQKTNAAHILDALGTLASLLDTEINKDKPSLQGELPIDNGSRVQGMIPPIVSNPVMVIRKRASSVFPLSDYIAKKRLSQHQHDLIVEALAARKNIVVAGGTRSGKTTFGNALLLKLNEMNPKERIVVMEDTIELQCQQENKVKLHTYRDIVTLNDLMRITMRLSPERIVIGEIRGGEALELLKSWNTGHPGGFTTIHANSALDALPRLEHLILEATSNPMREFIAKAVNIVIYFQHHPTVGPKAEQIIEIIGYKNGEYLWNPLG
jgi:type IV secretion system protein VirB11